MSIARVLAVLAALVLVGWPLPASANPPSPWMTCPESGGEILAIADERAWGYGFSVDYTVTVCDDPEPEDAYLLAFLSATGWGYWVPANVSGAPASR